MTLDEMYDAMAKLRGRIVGLKLRLEENLLDGRAHSDLTYYRKLEGVLLNDIQEVELLKIE